MGFEILPYSTGNGLMAAQPFFNIIIDPIIIIFLIIVSAIILPIICIITMGTSRKKVDHQVVKLEIMIPAFLKIFMDIKTNYGQSCNMVYTIRRMELELLELKSKKLINLQPDKIIALRKKIGKINAYAKDNKAWRKPCPKYLRSL